MAHDYTLLTPGPVPLPPEVRSALSQPTIHHRTPEFAKIFESVLTKLPQIFQTQQPAFIHTATGTGAMESAIVNSLKARDKVIVIEAGKFGQRWTEIAQTYNLKVQEVKIWL